MPSYSGDVVWALERQDNVKIMWRKEIIFLVVLKNAAAVWIKQHSAIEMSAADDVNGLLNPKRIETAILGISITYNCPLITIPLQLKQKLSLVYN